MSSTKPMKLRYHHSPDVTLSDQRTGVVDALSQASLEHLGLQTTLQEILDLQGQHVIETHAGLIEHTDTDETADKGVTLEETLGVFVVELEEFTGSTTDFGEDEGNTPNLALVAETILANELQLGIPVPTLTSVPDISGARSRSVALGYHIQTSGLERTTGDAVRLGVGAGGRHCGCRWREKFVERD